MTDTGLESLLAALAHVGVELPRVAVATARAVPIVLIVPAFGLRGTPLRLRVGLAFLLALCIYPALSAPAPTAHGLGLDVFAALLSGLPIAVSAAVPLWACSMAGGLADALRGTDGEPLLARPSMVLACALFFATGSPARIAAALVRASLPSPRLLAMVTASLLSGIELALTIAAPMLAASIVVDVAARLVARAPSPIGPAIVAPARSLALLALIGLGLERVTSFVAIVLARGP